MQFARPVFAFALASAALACDPPREAPPPVLPAPTASAPSAPPPASAAPVDLAPAPFTSEQIRGASRPGRTYVWRVETAGKPTVKRRIVFTKVEPERAEIELSVVDEDGKEIEKSPPKSVTWDELRKHGEFPRSHLTARDETLQVPAGTFDCVVYTVTEGDQVTAYYFAKKLPGAPIYFFTDKGGQRVMTSTLMEHRPGW
jgi:hypothetical protein